MLVIVNGLLCLMLYLGLEQLGFESQLGLFFIFAPIGVWTFAFFYLVHKSLLASILFWGGFLYLNWEMAVFTAVVWGSLCFAKKVVVTLCEHDRYMRTNPSAKHVAEPAALINPATGLFMQGDVDSSGNCFGQYCCGKSSYGQSSDD